MSTHIIKEVAEIRDKHGSKAFSEGGYNSIQGTASCSCSRVCLGCVLRVCRVCWVC